MVGFVANTERVLHPRAHHQLADRTPVRPHAIRSARRIQLDGVCVPGCGRLQIQVRLPAACGASARSQLSRLGCTRYPIRLGRFFNSKRTVLRLLSGRGFRRGHRGPQRIARVALKRLSSPLAHRSSESHADVNAVDVGQAVAHHGTQPCEYTSLAQHFLQARREVVSLILGHPEP
jgi:hypothetical protein